MPATSRVLALLTCVFTATLVDAHAASLTVTPASATLSAGQGLWFSADVAGSAAGFSWSISPALGSITNGYYVAPSNIISPQTVVLTAINTSNSSQTGAAVISLLPSAVPVVSSASISLSPNYTLLSPGQSKAFTAFINGLASNTSVSWSLSPAVGTVNNGYYQAPIAVAGVQLVKLTATYNGDSTVTASATIMVGGAATVNATTISVSPSSGTLSAGQAMWFSAVTSDNSGVSWSLSPPVGIIRNGYYSAPTTISTSQTVMLTATSLNDPSKNVSVCIYLVGTSGGSTPSGQPPQPTPSGQPPQSAPTAIQLAPSSISLKQGQAAQFSVSATGGSAGAVSWSLVPNVGSVVNGVYTAPSTVTTQTAVTVLATSVSNPVLTASASITLQPPAPSVSLSVLPSSASVTAGGVAVFGANVAGTSNTGVTWSLSPSVGSISNGTYTAPALITSQQAVTVTATSVADPTKSASAIVTLIPAAVSLAPSTISLSAGKSAQFTASVTGASNTGVTWSINPPVGSVTNGLYVAPATITSAQNVTLTAASLADPTKSAQAIISLAASSTTSITISPAQISLGPSQTQQFSATASSSIGGTGPVSVQWSISPNVGSITQAGLYTAPASITTTQNVSIIATSSAVSASANVTLAPGVTPQSLNSTVQLPLEVMGSAGSTVPVTVNVPAGSNVGGQLQLWLQIHGLKYETEASVQVNGGSWIPINTSTVTFQDNAGMWGGIGGGFSTIKVTLNLPAGSIVAGSNTLVFRFNGTDGVTSGFRILNFNILSNGSQLLPQSSFTWNDPTTWQPPLNTASDIQAGQNLWRTAPLTSAGGPIQAHCSDCHAQDGRDLKYFNYSNYSIRVRSMFHGLTAQQGDQIASYIRSLNAPAPANARPWNPPYQPGPGLDSQPVTNWAAGAGLDAVLANDAQEIAYVYPTGSNPPTLNARETPIFLQLPDWNRWLPQVAPQDSGAFNTPCNNSFGPFGTLENLSGDYQAIRTTLGTAPASAQAYSNAALMLWGRLGSDVGCVQRFMEQTPNWSSPTYVMQVHSVSLWMVTKLWEINQEFGLEGMPSVGFAGTGLPKTTSAPTEPRAWVTSIPFYVSPFMDKIPVGPGIGNGSRIAFDYESFIWYHLQLILNDSNGYGAGTNPIDWGYALAYVSNNLAWDQDKNVPRTGTAGLLSEWWAINQAQQPGQIWMNWMSPTVVSDISPAQLTQVLNNESQELWGILGSETAAQYCNGPCPAFDSNPFTSTSGSWYYQLPILNRYGVSNVTQWANWLAAKWPSADWLGDIKKTCVNSPPPYGWFSCN